MGRLSVPPKSITGDGCAATVFEMLTSAQDILPPAVARDLSRDIFVRPASYLMSIWIRPEPYTVHNNPEILRTSPIDSLLSDNVSCAHDPSTAHPRSSLNWVCIRKLTKLILCQLGINLEDYRTYPGVRVPYIPFFLAYSTYDTVWWDTVWYVLQLFYVRSIFSAYMSTRYAGVCIYRYLESLNGNSTWHKDNINFGPDKSFLSNCSKKEREKVVKALSRLELNQSIQVGSKLKLAMISCITRLISLNTPMWHDG